MLEEINVGEANLSHPGDPDAVLTRTQTARALTAAGFPVAPSTLSSKACRGGGPAYRVFSGKALYRWGDALAWAQASATAPRGSTSEVDTQRAA